MAEQAAAAGLAARAAVLLESLAPSPSLPPNATSNGSDWGASQVQTDGSGSMNSSSPVVTGSSGGGGGGGTPGWQTGLLTVLVAAAVILAVVTMFMLITSRLRRQRRQVLASLARIQEAEMADFEAADLEAARRWHAGMVARAMERRSRQQPPAAARQVVFSASRRDPLPSAAAAAGRPARPPVLVIQPDLGVGLCTLEEPAGSCGDGGEKERGGAGPAGDSSGVAPSNSGGLAAAGTAPRSAVYSAAAGGGTGTLQAAAVAAAGPAAEPPPLPQLPVRLQRIALEFPGLGAAVLLLLPHQHGWLVWQEGSSWQQAAPRGPLPPMSSVEVLPEAAAAPAGAGAELARPGGGAARGGPPSEGAAEDALAADGAGSEGGGATQAAGTQ